MAKISADDQKIADDLFEKFDKNKNGELTLEELKWGLRCAHGTNPTRDEIDKILKDMGIANKKGQKISRDQFTKAIVKYSKDCKTKTVEDEEKELMSAFAVFDRNKNGNLEKGELVVALKNLGEKLTDADINKMFAAADVDKDGKINYKEFVKMMTKDMK